MCYTLSQNLIWLVAFFFLLYNNVTQSCAIYTQNIVTDWLCVQTTNSLIGCMPKHKFTDWLCESVAICNDYTTKSLIDCVTYTHTTKSLIGYITVCHMLKQQSHWLPISQSICGCVTYAYTISSPVDCIL